MPHLPISAPCAPQSAPSAAELPSALRPPIPHFCKRKTRKTIIGIGADVPFRWPLWRLWGQAETAIGVIFRLWSDCHQFQATVQRVDLHFDRPILPMIGVGRALWKEAKKPWQELLDGKYEWSSIGKQLRTKGLAY
jgi:hypothetical protein